MATWTTLSPSDLIPEEVTDALGQLESLLSPLLPVLEGAQVTLDTLADVIEAIEGFVTNTLGQIINSLIEDLLQTQVSILAIKPTFSRRDQPGGLGKFGQAMKAAFSDAGDFNRPTFGDGDVSGGIVLLINAPTFVELAEIAEAFTLLFGQGWKEILDVVASFPGVEIPYFKQDTTGTITSIPDTASPFTTFVDSAQQSPNRIDLFTGTRIRMLTGLNAGRDNLIGNFAADGTFTLKTSYDKQLAVGDTYIISEFKPARPPDWETVRLVDVVPPVRDVVRFLANARDALEPPPGFADIVRTLVNTINQKILLIQTIINQIQEFSDLMQSVADVANINVLPVSFQAGGNGRFIQEYEFSDNQPPVDDDNVTMGLVVYGGAGTSTALNYLFPFF